MRQQKLESTALKLLVILINLRFFLVLYNYEMGLLSWVILLYTICLIKKTELSFLKICICFFLLFSYLSNPYAKDTLLVLASLCAFKRMRISQFASINLLCSILILIWAIIMVTTGAVEERTMLKSFDTDFVTYDLGFGNPNALASFLFYIIVNLYILLNKKKGIAFIIVLFCSLLSYKYTGSRTFFIAELTLLLWHLFKHTRFNNKWIMIFQLTAIQFIIYYFSFNYDPIIDILVSKRLSYYNVLFSNMSLKDYLFGYNYSQVEEMPLDNAYISIIVFGGIVYLLIFLYLSYKAFWHHFDKANKYTPIIASIMIAGIGESPFVAFGTANVLLLWLILIECNNTKNKLYYSIK